MYNWREAKLDKWWGVQADKNLKPLYRQSLFKLPFLAQLGSNMLLPPVLPHLPTPASACLVC